MKVENILQIKSKYFSGGRGGDKMKNPDVETPGFYGYNGSDYYFYKVSKSIQ
jgi:hypothetical protein